MKSTKLQREIIAQYVKRTRSNLTLLLANQHASEIQSDILYRIVTDTSGTRDTFEKMSSVPVSKIEEKHD
jgi:hypothetical protein